MSEGQPPIPQVIALVRGLRDWFDDPRVRDEFARIAACFDRFGQEFAEAARRWQEYAAWCRLGAGLVRGEDVPESIYPQPGEDPADTARWQKWRLS